MPYLQPSPDIVAIVDAPPTPGAALRPDGRVMALVEYEPNPPISLLARPFLRLGGVRIDPARGSKQRLTQFTAITLLDVETGVRTPIRLPAGARVGPPVWSHDGTRLAFTRDFEDRVELWVADPATGEARALAGVRLNDVLTGAVMLDPATGEMRGDGLGFAWMRDNRRLLVRAVPANRGPAPQTPATPEGPVIQETAGKTSQIATYQDLLENVHDEALFEHFATAQLAIVDVESGRISEIGAPGMFTGVRIAPDDRHLLVQQVKRPFSYRVPYNWFSRTTEVWTVAGERLVTVADLPVSDEVPRQGVTAGPRAVTWQPLYDARLLWVEALDGGDPMRKVPHRDKVLTLAAPFTEEPRELLRVVHRFAGWDWTAHRDDVLMTEYDRDRRWGTTYRLDLSEPRETRRVLFDLSVNDEYNDPGHPIYEARPNGEHVMLQDGEWAYFAGRGASEEGDRPFLDRRNLSTNEVERLFQSSGEVHENVVECVGGSSDRLIIRHESRTEPPNYVLFDRRTGERRPLTSFSDPHPQVTGMHKEMIRYQRADGTPLSGTLMLPPGWQPGMGRLPLVIWAYPMEYSDPATAGQVRGTDRNFTRLGGTSPAWFALKGYAVLLDAAMPVVGDPETMNDTFIEQIVDAARAAIDTLDARGIIDRERVVVSGHSYGAFMTANLLAHSDLFVAGIARSGAYNRSLTPFGFQSERRSYWEVPEIYHRVSPYTYAQKIKRPLLLIHGAVDNNPGTYTVQSERMFQALQGTGGTARLVLLPFESHAYRARESILHVLAEMFSWADRWAGAGATPAK